MYTLTQTLKPESWTDRYSDEGRRREVQWGGSVEKRQQEDKGHSWTVPLPLGGLFDCEGRTTRLAARVLLHVARTECGCEEGEAALII